MKRDIVEIRSRDYWFKIVEMLQQNWALIDIDPSGLCLVYFVHDGSGVFDEMHFTSEQEAQSQSKQNGFRRYAEDIRAQEFIGAPKPPFSKDSHPNGPIYSSGRYWSHSTPHSPRAHYMFKIGSEYTRDEIHGHLGGSIRSYLPTVLRHVVAACVKPELNPRAPNVVLCGKGQSSHQPERRSQGSMTLCLYSSREPPIVGNTRVNSKSSRRIPLGLSSKLW